MISKNVYIGSASHNTPLLHITSGMLTCYHFVPFSYIASLMLIDHLSSSGIIKVVLPASYGIYTRTGGTFLCFKRYTSVVVITRSPSLETKLIYPIIYTLKTLTEVFWILLFKYTFHPCQQLQQGLQNLILLSILNSYCIRSF